MTLHVLTCPVCDDAGCEFCPGVGVNREDVAMYDLYLLRVTNARAAVDDARAELDASIRSAVDAGATLRAVAEAAGTSHETARRISGVERAVERADTRDKGES